MSSHLVVTLVTFAAFFGRGVKSTLDIPSFLKICHRSDPHLNECIKRSVDSLRPYLKTGISALHIPPCEPLNVPEIELSQAAGPVSIRSTYTNIKVWGGTEFILKSVNCTMRIGKRPYEQQTWTSELNKAAGSRPLDTDKDRIRLKLYVPRLEMKSDYKMEGKILMLPITGQGAALGNYTDIDVVVTIQGERYQDRRTDNIHFRVLEFYCDFDVGHASIHLDNLFNGDETLADAMNLFLNDNWKTVAAEIKPALEDTVSKLFKNFSNKIYSKYPIDTLLPP